MDTNKIPLLAFEQSDNSEYGHNHNALYAIYDNDKVKSTESTKPSKDEQFEKTDFLTTKSGHHHSIQVFDC